MKVIIDDVCKSIETDDETFQCDAMYKFYEAVELLLTPSQFLKFTMIDTNRVFQVSEKRINLLRNFLDSHSH